MGVGRVFLAAVIAYVVGSVPTDRAADGSKPDNGSRLRLLAEVAKVAAACAIGSLLAGDHGAQVAGSAAVAGHHYPFFRRSAARPPSLATALAQSAVVFPLFVPVFAAAALVSRTSPWRDRTQRIATALCGAWVLAAIWWWTLEVTNLWGPAPTGLLALTVGVSSAVVLARYDSSASTTQSSSQPR